MSQNSESLLNLLDSDVQALFHASGREIIQKMGMDTVRLVVLDVLSGRNLRDSTEILTRRRLAVLNAAILALMVNGSKVEADFINRLPEIALDKVSRFSREIELGSSKWYLATLIIVDRIAKGSRIRRLAQQIDGDIVQMSLAFWPQEVAKILHQRVGFTHPLVTMPPLDVGPYLRHAIQTVPMEKFLPQ